MVVATTGRRAEWGGSLFHRYARGASSGDRLYTILPIVDNTVSCAETLVNRVDLVLSVLT